MAIMNSTTDKSLSNDIIKKINERTIKNNDKYLRVNDGIYTTLTSYKNGIIYLEIWNTEKKYPTCYNTASEFAENWISWHEELKNANGFVASFYKVVSDGFLFNITQNGEDIILNDIVEEYFENDELEFDAIYSGKHSYHNHEMHLEDNLYNYRKDGLTSEEEGEIVKFLSSHFETVNYQKEIINIGGESLACILAKIDSENVIKVLWVIKEIIRKFNFIFINWKRKGTEIHITENFLCCSGATFVINKKSIVEKYDRAIEEFKNDMQFLETSQFIYFTGDPLSTKVADGFEKKYLRFNVEQNMSKYFECQYWSHYEGKINPPLWIEECHDFGEGNFVVWSYGEKK